MRVKANVNDSNFKTLEENLQGQLNSIQKKIIQFMRPIAKKIPD